MTPTTEPPRRPAWRTLTAAPALLALPALAVIAVFVAALGGMLGLSLGLLQASPNPRIAELNGEATQLTLSLWIDFLVQTVSLVVVVPIVTIPIWTAMLALALLTVVAGILSRRTRGAQVVAVALWAIVVVPFLTVPAGDDLLRIAEWTSNSADHRLLFESATLAVTAGTFACLIAVPVAYLLSFGAERTRGVLLVLVLLPFLTSFLLRVFAWRVVLGETGLLNSALVSLGIIPPDEPLQWLGYSPFAVIVVLVYAWTPFIVLPLYLAFRAMDPRLLEAAADLGASRAGALRRLTLPLAIPGLVAAFLLVFIPSLGEYIVPALVGGPEGYMYGQAVAQAFVGGSLNWQHGALLALFLIGIVVFVTARAAPLLRSGLRTTDGGGGSGRDLAASPLARGVLWVFFAAFLAFLYAPTFLLVVFSFNDAPAPAFPLNGFTVEWYVDALTNPDLLQALGNSALVALGAAAIAVVAGALVSYPLARGRLRGADAVSAAMLIPLVAPPVVLGVALLILFQRGPAPIALGLHTVALAHAIIALPYAVLILLPAFRNIDPRWEESARDLGAGAYDMWRRVLVPLLSPSAAAAFIICFVVSFDEVVVASFVVGSSPTFPVYLYSGLRFSDRLMPLVAMSTVLIVGSAIIGFVAERLRNRAAIAR